jgi:hypothetical protein
MGRGEVHTGFWWGYLREGDRLEDNIKKRFFEKLDWEHGPDRFGLGQGQMTGSCECGNEPLSFIKCKEFLH